MRKIREVLRLHHQLKLSRRQIATSLSISRDTVALTLERANEAGLSWPADEGLTDTELAVKLYGSAVPPQGQRSSKRPTPDWAWVHRELARKHVTLRLLWEEFREANPDGVRYSWFCEQYRRWARHVDPVMRLEHKAGEKLFVDYAGDRIEVVDPLTGEVRQAHLFVATLGCSSYTYVEATWTEQLSDWIGAHVRALTFFGGSTRLIVPDNTATAVKKPCFYEPELNRTYEEMAAHYGAAVLPARVRKARDKAKVESAVLHVQRRILARLRKHTFFSLGALNDQVREELKRLNEAPFQKLEGSRRSRFELLDKPALAQLPATPYCFALWRHCRAGVDYHVEVEKHFYSVPYQLIRRKLDVRYTDRTVEVFYKGERVASHRRSHRPYGYTTVPEHMPSSHRRYAEWSPERIRRWAARIGDHTVQVCDHFMRTRPHPEHGFRSCMGIISLARRYGNDRTEAACARALKIGALRYRSIASILKRGLENAPLFEADTEAVLPEHEHIRGPGYYH
jgi:transposase